MWETLFNVFAGVLRQLKHRRRAFSTKEGFKQMIRVDVPAVLFVLEAVLLDIGPQFFGHLRAGNRLAPNNRGQDGVRLDGFHKRCIRFLCHSFLSPWFGLVVITIHLPRCPSARG